MTTWKNFGLKILDYLAVAIILGIILNATGFGSKIHLPEFSLLSPLALFVFAAATTYLLEFRLHDAYKAPLMFGIILVGVETGYITFLALLAYRTWPNDKHMKFQLAICALVCLGFAVYFTYGTFVLLKTRCWTVQNEKKAVSLPT